MELLYLYWILQGLIFDMIGSIFIVKGLYPMFIPDDKENQYYDEWDKLKKFQPVLDRQAAEYEMKFRKDVDDYYKTHTYDENSADWPTEELYLKSKHKGELERYCHKNERKTQDAYTNFRHHNNIRKNKLQHEQALSYAKKGLIFLLGGFSLIFLGTLFLFKISNL